MPSPSGAQMRLVHGSQTATVVAVGAGVREYRVGGTDVVMAYGHDEIAPAYDGALLAPWPNRLRDGQFDIDGVTYQVPIDEPDRRTALHGLVAHARFDVVDEGDASVTLVHDVVPTSGYPWPLHLEVTHALADDGLTVTIRATCDGPGAAPLGFGWHPWLEPGPGGLDACTLTLDVEHHVVNDDRLLPIGTDAPHSGLAAGLPLGGVDLDDAWTGAAHDANGRTVARLLRSDGATTTVWGDRSVVAWQVCTGDHVPVIARRAVAVEPMTCIADAFRTGDDLLRLEPGQEHVTRWGISMA